MIITDITDEFKSQRSVDTMTVYCCDDTFVDIFFYEGELSIGSKRFSFPIGKPSKPGVVRVFTIESLPKTDGGFKTFLRYMDHVIPLQEIINTSQEELNEKYFDKQFEKRYPHRVEKVKPVRKAKAKQVTEKKENCGCKKNLKGNEKNKKTKKNH